MDDDITASEVIGDIVEGAWFQRDCAEGFIYLTDGLGWKEPRDSVVQEVIEQLGMKRQDYMAGWGQDVKPTGKTVWHMPTETLDSLLEKIVALRRQRMGFLR